MQPTSENSERRLSGILRHISESSQESTIQYSRCSTAKPRKLPLKTDTKAELTRERSKASFPIKELTIFLDGSKRYTEFKQLVAQQIEYDPVLNDPDVNRTDLTRPEYREKTMRKLKHIQDLWMAMKASNTNNPNSNDGPEVKFTSGLEKNFSDAFWEVMSMSDTSWSTRLGVHFGLFLPTIHGQGTEEQKKAYDDLSMSLRITGCYAMTELGHGSNVAGLETTATYDKTTQEFIINTPTLTATKWWIGGAAHTASHSIVYAQLIIDEKTHGVHPFIVPLRNLEDGSPRPGVYIGDCGAKMGRNGLDNGYIQFDHVRIPRESMLMRWSSVSPEGEFHKPPRKQLAYGALIGGRVTMVKDSSDFMKKALTIAIRYSAIRRQFSDEDDNEKQILNYQTHQHRLFPLLAATFGTHFTASILRDRYIAMQADLNEENLSSLAGVHATSAGLKAFTTWWANQGLETCRQCLGGHGYSAYTGISELLGDFAVMCTWEGDNTVLAQQLARYLIKQLRKSTKKKKTTVGFECYIGNSARILSSFFTAENFEVEELLKAHEYVAIKVLVETEKRLHYLRIQYGNKTKAWQDCIVDLVESARAHVNYFISHCFVEAVKQAPASIKPILTQLCMLHSLTLIEQNLGTLLRESFLKSFHVDYIQNKIRELYKTIREQAVPLVDSFNIPDVILNSPFGRYDGDVYEEYFKVVNNAPNATGNPTYYDELVKPLHLRPYDD